MDTCTSDYEPSSIVESFHDIPHFDIDFDELNSTYEQTVDEYFEAIIIWSCLPILFGLVLIVLLSVCWGVLCCYRRCRRKESPTTFREPSRWTKGFLVAVVLTCAVIGVIICGGCFYAEVELDKDIEEIKSAASFAESTINNIRNQVNMYNTNSRSIQLQILSIRVDVSAGSETILDELRLTDVMLKALYDRVGNLTAGYSLLESADEIDKFEVPRHWTVIALLIVLVLLFVLLFIVVLLRSPIPITLVAVAVFILMVLMWCASGAALGEVILSADLCYDPDRTLLNHIGSGQTEEITKYYLYCVPGCADNDLVERARDIQNATEMAGEQFARLNESITTRSEQLEGHLISLGESIEGINSTADRLARLVNCASLHQGYTKARDDFCDMGFIYTLTLFCAASVLALLLYLILCVSKSYINVLRSADRWDTTGFSYNFSPTPDIQSNGHSNGSNDAMRQTSVRRKQQYDGWVAGKIHQGNYTHRGEGSTSEYELQDSHPPEYTDVLVQ